MPQVEHLARLLETRALIRSGEFSGRRRRWPLARPEVLRPAPLPTLSGDLLGSPASARQRRSSSASSPGSTSPRPRFANRRDFVRGRAANESACGDREPAALNGDRAPQWRIRSGQANGSSLAPLRTGRRGSARPLALGAGKPAGRWSAPSSGWQRANSSKCAAGVAGSRSPGAHHQLRAARASASDTACF